MLIVSAIYTKKRLWRQDFWGIIENLYAKQLAPDLFCCVKNILLTLDSFLSEINIHRLAIQHEELNFINFSLTILVKHIYITLEKKSLITLNPAKMLQVIIPPTYTQITWSLLSIPCQVFFSNSLYTHLVYYHVRTRHLLTERIRVGQI